MFFAPSFIANHGLNQIGYTILRACFKVAEQRIEKSSKESKRSSPPSDAIEVGKIKVDRVWEDTNADYGYALVTYINNTTLTFTSAVTIECTALDKNNNKIGINSRSFFVHDIGNIHPNFSGTKEVPVRLYGKTLTSMSCKISRAR